MHFDINHYDSDDDDHDDDHDDDDDDDDANTGENNISPMDPLGAEDGTAWREDHQEDHHDAGRPCHQSGFPIFVIMKMTMTVILNRSVFRTR